VNYSVEGLGNCQNDRATKAVFLRIVNLMEKFQKKEKNLYNLDDRKWAVG